RMINSRCSLCLSNSFICMPRRNAEETSDETEKSRLFFSGISMVRTAVRDVNLRSQFWAAFKEGPTKSK
ncbi:hypothetical protein PFISCL1PPCAC_20748, partial [Pristionchus fissidentatus]